MSKDKKYMVEQPYEPYLVKAPCWIRNGGKTEIFYDYVPASFARHPCDLFDKNGEREVWKSLTEYTADNCKDMLPKKEGYLRDNIAGGLEVSNFGRVGIRINCKSSCKCSCKICHYILPQYEKCSWNDSKQEFENYNGWLVVKINGMEEYVYSLVAEAFEIKENGKQIHHLDNNGHHNTPDNLKALTSEEHAKEHNQARGCEMCCEASEKED